MSVNIKYEIIQAPVDPIFYAWYPYIKPENLIGENRQWRNCLDNALKDRLPGLKSIFITAKDTEANRYVGVIWVAIPVEYPFVAHYGWFYNEPTYRGFGIGSNIFNICEEYDRDHKIKLVMLPTSTHLMAHEHIYLKRGWKDSLVEAATGEAFMIKEYEDHFAESLALDSGEFEIGTIGYGDYLLFDYLINSQQFQSRLYNLDAKEGKRILSFEQEWDKVQNMVLRRNGALRAVAILSSENDHIIVDADAFSEEDMVNVIRAVQDKHRNQKFIAYLNKSDIKKMEAFKKSGFCLTGSQGLYDVFDFGKGK
jgi:GNAT superfamily N-acetyltransferase